MSLFVHVIGFKPIFLSIGSLEAWFFAVQVSPPSRATSLPRPLIISPSVGSSTVRSSTTRAAHPALALLHAARPTMLRRGEDRSFGKGPSLKEPTPLPPTPHTLLPRLITLCPHSPLPSLGCRVGPPLSPLERSHYVCSSSRCRVSCRPKRGGPSRSWASNHLRYHPCCSACTRTHTHTHTHMHTHGPHAAVFLYAHVRGVVGTCVERRAVEEAWRRW